MTPAGGRTVEKTPTRAEEARGSGAGLGVVPARTTAQSVVSIVVLKVKGLGRRLSEKGRVEVEFEDGAKYSIDASRIKELYFLDGRFYVVYETENADFYKKYTSEVPALATKLSFKVKEIIEERCKRCKSLIEWDADEPFCPKCGGYYGYDEIPVKLLERGMEFREEIEAFARRLLETDVEYVDMLYWNPAGGFTPLFDLSPVHVTLYTCVVKGVAIVENPTFEESHWDEAMTYKRVFEGKFAVLQVSSRSSFGSWYYVLFRLRGEPRLGLVNMLIEKEKERRRREEEERKRREEEWRRKEEEEKRKWGDPKAVIEAVLAKLPSWADGAYVKKKTVWSGGEADVVTYVMPVKHSQRGSGYYTSESWRSVSAGVPERYLEPLAGQVVTRDGQVVKVKERNRGRYVELEVVS